MDALYYYCGFYTSYSESLYSAFITQLVYLPLLVNLFAVFCLKVIWVTTKRKRIMTFLTLMECLHCLGQIGGAPILREETEIILILSSIMYYILISLLSEETETKSPSFLGSTDFSIQTEFSSQHEEEKQIISQENKKKGRKKESNLTKRMENKVSELYFELNF
jgi:hypothetical protein